MNKVYLGLGSNLGDRANNIKKTIKFFDLDDRFESIKVSSLYETMPYGNREQPNFINCVISFFSRIDANNLLILIKELEKRIGRITMETWTPREIDIDILLFGDLIVEKNDLSIPHKDLINRDFVLVPLLELNQEVMHPVMKKKLKSFLSQLNDKYIIDKINFNLSLHKT